MKDKVPDPTWAKRIIDWFKIFFTLKKVLVILLGFGAVSFAGNIQERDLWKDVAYEVGIMDPPVDKQKYVPHHHHRLLPHEHNHDHPHTHPELQEQLPEDHLRLHGE